MGLPYVRELRAAIAFFREPRPERASISNYVISLREYASCIAQLAMLRWGRLLGSCSSYQLCIFTGGWWIIGARGLPNTVAGGMAWRLCHGAPHCEVPSARRSDLDRIRPHHRNGVRRPAGDSVCSQQCVAFSCGNLLCSALLFFCAFGFDPLCYATRTATAGGTCPRGIAWARCRSGR